MVYDPNIPQPGDDPSDSQDDLLKNMSAINSQFAINHNAFTTTSSQAGYHKKIFFPTGLVSDPNLVAPESAVYPKLVDGVAQLFFQNGASSDDVIQLTSLSPVQSGSNYFIKLFGLKLAWGQFTATGATATITFSGTFNSATAAVGTEIDDSGSGSRACTVKTGTLTTTGVQFAVSNSGLSGYYLVIGT